MRPLPRGPPVRRGVDMVRREACDGILALGGGRVMDASKGIAAAAFYGATNARERRRQCKSDN
ncbi:iron-containing alcohol dehydrogenase [Aminirod propionatiphilus]|uniref:iron-containing alcohol dehydrogenase n=1 Tax=Aminirod propionatiphilus TaxID=3415223 RepID=UPI0023674DD8